jgi:hypothetical protein
MQKMKFLFLDYDGVLHPSEVYRNPSSGRLFMDRALAKYHTLFEHAPLLERLIDESEVDVKIVLSTSWVRVLRNFNRTKRYLPKGLQERVVGATWHTCMSNNSLGTMDSDSTTSIFTSMTRCQQIISHCERNQIASAEWVAIDDEAQGWDERFRDNLVQTDDVSGLGNLDTQQELLRKLRAER